MIDNVNHPNHYTGGSIECIDAIKEAVKDLTGIEATDTGNAIKYLWRWSHKNGIEDLKKAIWYIKHLIWQKENLTTEERLRALHTEKMELDKEIDKLTTQLRKEELEMDVGL
jgi:hypothetical protein